MPSKQQKIAKKQSNEPAPPRPQPPDYTNALWVTPGGPRGVIIKNRWFTGYGEAWQFLREITGEEHMTEEAFHNTLRRYTRITSPLVLVGYLRKSLGIMVNPKELGRMIAKTDTDWDKITL